MILSRQTGRSRSGMPSAQPPGSRPGLGGLLRPQPAQASPPASRQAQAGGMTRQPASLQSPGLAAGA
jgi:hypothetical protein